MIIPNIVVDICLWCGMLTGLVGTIFALVVFFRALNNKYHNDFATESTILIFMPFFLFICVGAFAACGLTLLGVPINLH